MYTFCFFEREASRDNADFLIKNEQTFLQIIVLYLHLELV